MAHIGDDYIDLHYDGDNLPREAREAGERAGREAGEGFADEMDDAIQDGADDTFDDLEDRAGDAGDDSGEAFGENFADSSDREIRQGFEETGDHLNDQSGRHGERSGRTFSDKFADNVDRTLSGRMRTVADRVAKAFDDDDGVKKFVDNYRGAGDGVDALREKLDYLHRNNVLNDGDFTRLSEEVDGFARNRSIDEFVGRMEALNRQVNDSRNSLDGFNEDLDRVNRVTAEREPMDGFIQRMRDATQTIQDGRADRERLARDVADLAEQNRLANEQQRLFNRDIDEGTRSTRGLIGPLDELGTQFENERESLRRFRDHVDELGGSIRDTTGDTDRFIGPLREVGGTAEEQHERVLRFRDDIDHVRDSARNGGGDIRRLGGDLENLGDRAERGGGGADRGSAGFSKLFRAFSRFDPGDNLGQLIALIISVAGPAAVLLSGLAAQLVIVGTAAAGALFGAGGLIAAFVGLTGKFGPLSAGASAAKDALKGLVDPLKDLGLTVTNKTFEGLAEPFEALGKALPKLTPGVAAIGKALSGFLREFTEGATKNIEPINDLLKGFAPIVRDFGTVIVQLLGAIGGVFKAAMPFAQEFASDLAKTVTKFSDWVNSVKGQQQLKQWFLDAKEVMGQVNDLLGDLGTAFGKLITPETKEALKTILDDLGQIALDLADLSVALAPALEAVTTLVTGVTDVVSKLSPVIKGIGELAKGVVDVINPVIEFLASSLEPVFKATGAILEVVGAFLSKYGEVLGHIFDGLEAAFAPVKKLIEDVIDVIKNNYLHALELVQPVIDAFGDVTTALGDALGVLIGHFIDAGKGALGLKDGVDPVRAFLDGPFKTGVTNAANALKQFASKINNELIPAIEGMDWSQIQDGIKDIIDAAPFFITGIGKMGETIGDFIGLAGDGAGVLGGLAEVLGHLATGDFPGAITAAGKVGEALKTAGTHARDLKDDVNDMSGAFADGQAKIVSGAEKIKSGMEANLNPAGVAVGHLQTEIDKLKDKKVQIIQEGADPSSERVKALDANIKLLKDKQVQITEAGSVPSATRVDKLKQQIDKLQNKLVSVLEAGADPSSGRVVGLKGKIDALQGKLVTVEEKGAKPSDDRVDNLTTRINILKGKLVEVLEKGADPSSDRVKNLKGRIDNLEGKVVQVKEEGAAAARGRVEALNGMITTLRDKTVTITTNYVTNGRPENNKTSSTQNRYGGIMAGGKQLYGGEKFAFAAGGILNRPTFFGNVLAGEAGPEAIVPLTGPLSRVDRSVRALSAYARGAGTPGAAAAAQQGGAYVAEGAIRVYTSNTNGRQVASQVLDRLALAVS